MHCFVFMKLMNIWEYYKLHTVWKSYAIVCLFLLLYRFYRLCLWSSGWQAFFVWGSFIVFWFFVWLVNRFFVCSFLMGFLCSTDLLCGSLISFFKIFILLLNLCIYWFCRSDLRKGLLKVKLKVLICLWHTDHPEVTQCAWPWQDIEIHLLTSFLCS